MLSKQKLFLSIIGAVLIAVLSFSTTAKAEPTGPNAPCEQLTDRATEVASKLANQNLFLESLATKQAKIDASAEERQAALEDFSVKAKEARAKAKASFEAFKALKGTEATKEEIKAAAVQARQDRKAAQKASLKILRSKLAIRRSKQLSKHITQAVKITNKRIVVLERKAERLENVKTRVCEEETV